MRFPVIIGALSGLVLGIVLLAAFLASAISEPPRQPSPNAPTPPPVAVPTVTPSDSPLPTATTEPSPAVTQGGSPAEGVAVGQRPPAFELPALGGGTLDLTDYAGRPLWINFMATWCPPCQDELPMMQSMQEQLGEEVTIVLVDVGEDERTVEQFMDALGVTLPVGLDVDGDVQQQWGAYALPVHVWLDGEGVVTARIFGGAPRDLFVEAVLTVVPEAELEEDE